MTIKEYIEKNLPNLNWNILPQIFEENGVELTEEIETYLKETPENTNWNLLGKINTNKKRTIVFEGTITFTHSGEGHAVVYMGTAYGNIPKDLDYLYVTWDEQECSLPLAVNTGGTGYGELNSSLGMPDLSNFPWYISIQSLNSFIIAGRSSGTYSLKIEIEEE